MHCAMMVFLFPLYFCNPNFDFSLLFLLFAFHQIAHVRGATPNGWKYYQCMNSLATSNRRSVYFFERLSPLHIFLFCSAYFFWVHIISDDQ